MRPKTPKADPSAVVSLPGALMGVDWGGRRVGVALSDPSRTLARPLVVLVRTGSGEIPLSEGEEVVAALLKLVSLHEITGLVFGVPYYHLSGDPNPHAPLFRLAGEALASALSLPVFFVDEGQSSETAREIRDTHGGARRRHDPLDHLAAATLLQGFLDSPKTFGDPVASGATVSGEAQ